ncbi:MAG: metallophosphoesterase [Gemmataceae bacterium]
MRVHDEWLLTPDRVAVHEPSATAVIADLHLGYLEAHGGRRGRDFPLSPSPRSSGRWAARLKRTKAARLVIAGDLFEKRFLADLWAEFTDWLKRRGVALVGVVLGNHDRRWPQAEASVCRDALPLGDWQIVHDAARGRRTGRVRPFSSGDAAWRAAGGPAI